MICRSKWYLILSHSTLWPQCFMVILTAVTPGANIWFYSWYSLTYINQNAQPTCTCSPTVVKWSWNLLESTLSLAVKEVAARWLFTICIWDWFWVIERALSSQTYTVEPNFIQTHRKLQNTFDWNVGNVHKMMICASAGNNNVEYDYFSIFKMTQGETKEGKKQM